MDPTELTGHGLPPGTNDSWRTWLMTGIRRAPVDKRRVRGAHKGLKKMLVEGMALSTGSSYSWKEFSDAMVRQSVGDAMRQLPQRDAQVIKLAYFGGLSNHQIADRLGLSVASVERRLREAVARISRHVEQGRALGRRAIGAAVLWLSGRWLGEAAHHMVRAGAVATLAVIVAVQPASVGSPKAPATRPAQVLAAPIRPSAAPDGVRQSSSATQGLAGAPATSIPHAPVTLPTLPAVSVPPILRKLPAVKTPAQVPLRP